MTKLKDKQTEHHRISNHSRGSPCKSLYEIDNYCKPSALYVTLTHHLPAQKPLITLCSEKETIFLHLFGKLANVNENFMSENN